jgi:hypothetical protein
VTGGGNGDGQHTAKALDIAAVLVLVGTIVLLGLIFFTPTVHECFSHCSPEYDLQR